MAVAVEVPDRQREHPVADDVALDGLEGAVAVTQQDTKRGMAIKIPAGHGEVKIAVVVKVAHHDGTGSEADGVAMGGLEGAVPVSQQDTHGAGPAVGHSEVGDAVMVKVSRRHRGRPKAAGVVASSGLEGTVALAQQDAY